MTEWQYPGAVLDRVVDGDSFYARVTRTLDFGFHVTTTMSAVQKFRLNRCNAAPLGTPSGDGSHIVLGLLLGAAPFDLTSIKPYKFGDEWMAEVTMKGNNLTDLLLQQQWVAEWNGRGSAPLPPWPRTV